ncbi:hypothetical protein HFD88_009050 [Aspergillus terreus]|nr:hypothetical protein HFD88_009050 [Aspergillus terreus]
MPQVEGTFGRDTGRNRVAASFAIKQVTNNFKATVNPALPAFTGKAKLDYEKEDQLTGTRTYEGRIGPNDFTITLSNGAKISGQLNCPGIDDANTVTGNGAWEQH